MVAKKQTILLLLLLLLFLSVYEVWSSCVVTYSPRFLSSFRLRCIICVVGNTVISDILNVILCCIIIVRCMYIWNQRTKFMYMIFMTNMLLKDFHVLFSLTLSCCCKVFISFLERLIIWSLLFITFCKSLIMLCKYFVSLKALN